MTLTLFLDFKKVFAVNVFIQVGLMSSKTSAQPMSTSMSTSILLGLELEG
jgi:hypothetical protein